MTTCAGRMLIVDDEEAVRTVCARTIAAMGITVETASTAEQAWSMLNAGTFDCVLTDISMPGSMDGAALTEEVRERFPATDMLIMTGDPSLTTAVATLRRGALDYLIKPFASAVLEVAVTRCFERRRLSEELNREKALRLELEAAYAELQKAERAKDAFISVLNHELRTPLTIAVAAAELLEKGLDKDSSGQILEMLRSSLARENEVIEDLLLFSKLSAGDLPLQSSEVRVEEMIRTLAENYRSVREEKGARLEIRIDPALSVRGDAALLRTAFKHLLLNAIRFNTKGGLVRIEASRTPLSLELLFADEGIGIAPDQRSRVFDSFYQIAEHMTRKVGGLGLGLAIVRRIVEAHGGRVAVSGREGGGTEFRVSLPSVQAPLQAAASLH
jgi:signal transduction histidine kinase